MADRGKDSHTCAEPGCWSKAAARSGGTTRSSTASSSSQAPFVFATSIAAWPAGAIRPSASSRSTRLLFDRDHPLVGLRGQNQRPLRSSSSVRALLSIQPKARAWVTASS